MNTTVIALQNLYVALGGSLTDTYEDIADGVAVSNYVVIPDVINAIAQLKAAASTAEETTTTNNDDTADTTEPTEDTENTEETGGN